MTLRSLKGIKELKFILCQSSAHSEGLRNYIANNYKDIRQSKANITVRECESSYPFAIAVYAYGIEQTANLRKLNQIEIDDVIKQLQSNSQTVAQDIRV